jgi:hypothetical protein
MKVYVHPIVRQKDGKETTVLGTEHVLVLYVKNVWRGRHNVLERIKNLAKTMNDTNLNGQEYTGKFQVEIETCNFQPSIFIVKYWAWNDRKFINYYSRDLFCVTRKGLTNEN